MSNHQCEKEFSDNLLRIEEPQEDLPQSDSLKKWIKKLKVFGVITVSVLLVIAAAIGIVDYMVAETPKSDFLTVKSIVKTFKSQGLSLKEDKSKSPEEFELNGVKPAIFKIGKQKDTLLIYIFKSFVEREDIVSISNKFNRFNNSLSILETPFNAKNAFLVYIPSQTPTNDEEFNSLIKTQSSISEIVFKYLNEGKVLVYKGESSNWEGTFTLKYYMHWWKDESGVSHQESFSDGYQEIRYKAQDIESVGSIDFQYKFTSVEGKITGGQLDKEGSLKSRSGSGNVALSLGNEKTVYTIKWLGREEHMVLKPVNN